MAVVRPWVKGDLQTILHIGANRGAPMRRFRSQQKRQHVQCVEVDTERSAVKINDSETLVWCFVSKPGMKNFHKGSNPSFASLENKIITIEDYEFSTLGVLCPSSFGEKRAKSNGQICLLVSKFVLFSGERTTTVGTPSNLGEGNRELRAMLRNLSRPRDLVNVLALGQGLTDLLDLDGVLMSAADPSTTRVSWNDVDPQLLAIPATTPPTEEAPAPTPAPAPAPPAATDQRTVPPPVAEAPGRDEAPDEGGAVDPSSQGMSQLSLGMEYDGELDDGENDFHTQAPSAGNVFSQEAMVMRPASPTPSPPRSPPPPPQPPQSSTEVRASPARLPTSNGYAPGPPNVVPPLGTNGGTYDDAPLGQDGTGEEGQRQPQQQRDMVTGTPPSPALRGDGSGLVAGQREGGSAARRGRGRTRSEVEDREEGRREEERVGLRKGGGEKNEEEDNAEEEQEEEEDEEDIGEAVPPGFTQLDPLPEAEMAATAAKRPGEEDMEEEEEDEDEDELLGARRGNGPAGATRSRHGPTAIKGKGKRKARANVTDGRGGSGNSGSGGGGGGGGGEDDVRASWQQPAPQQGRSKGKGKGKAKAPESTSTGGGGSAAAPRAPTQGSPSDEFLSPQEVSGGTSSSSQIQSPECNQLDLSCRTQKRQNEGQHPLDSGARAASRKCDIRRRFSGGDGSGGGGGRRGGGGNSNAAAEEEAKRSGGDDAEDSEEPFQSQDTVELEADERIRERNPIFERAAKLFPERPLRTTSSLGRERDQPLSDVLIAVNPKWDGNGRPPIIARGYDVDPMLASWLDEDMPAGVRYAPASIGEWLDRNEKHLKKRSRSSVWGRGGAHRGAGASW